MGMEDEMEDFRWEQARREALKRPATHFAAAHQGKVAFILHENNETTPGTIGPASGDDDVLFDYIIAGEWRDETALTIANINMVFLGDSKKFDLREGIAVTNPHATAARQAAQVHIEADKPGTHL